MCGTERPSFLHSHTSWPLVLVARRLTAFKTKTRVLVQNWKQGLSNHRPSWAGGDTQKSSSWLCTEQLQESHAMCLRVLSKQLLKSGGSEAMTTSLRTLFQCLSTLWVKVFLMSNLSLLWCTFMPFPHILSSVTRKKISARTTSPGCKGTVTVVKVVQASAKITFSPRCNTQRLGGF